MSVVVSSVNPEMRVPESSWPSLEILAMSKKMLKLSALSNRLANNECADEEEQKLHEWEIEQICRDLAPVSAATLKSTLALPILEYAKKQLTGMAVESHIDAAIQVQHSKRTNKRVRFDEELVDCRAAKKCRSESEQTLNRIILIAPRKSKINMMYGIAEALTTLFRDSAPNPQ